MGEGLAKTLGVGYYLKAVVVGEDIGDELGPMGYEGVGFGGCDGAAFGATQERVPLVGSEGEACGERDGFAAARGDAHLEVVAGGVGAAVEDEADSVGMVYHSFFELVCYWAKRSRMAVYLLQTSVYLLQRSVYCSRS